MPRPYTLTQGPNFTNECSLCYFHSVNYIIFNIFIGKLFQYFVRPTKTYLLHDILVQVLILLIFSDIYRIHLLLYQVYLYTGAAFRELSLAVISRVTFPSGRKVPLQLLSHMTNVVESDVFNMHVEYAFSLKVQEIEALSYDFSQYGVLVNLSSGGFTSPICKDRISY